PLPRLGRRRRDDLADGAARGAAADALADHVRHGLPDALAPGVVRVHPAPHQRGPRLLHHRGLVAVGLQGGVPELRRQRRARSRRRDGGRARRRRDRRVPRLPEGLPLRRAPLATQGGGQLMPLRPRAWWLVLLLAAITVPIVVGYLWIVIGSFNTRVHGITPVGEWTLENWRFLGERLGRRPSIWTALLNTLLFAG